MLREDSNQVRRVVQPANFDAAKDLAFGLTEAGRMLQKIWENLKSLTPEVLTLPGKRISVPSLYHLGAMRWHQGWSLRFAFPQQEATIQLLREAIVSGTALPNYTPRISTDQGAELWQPTDSYDELFRRSSNCQHKVRKRRR